MKRRKKSSLPSSKTRASRSEQRAERWRWRNRRRLRLTREGRGYIAVSIGVGLAAINTGNNLLYLLLGWLLSVIIASGFMSNAMVRALKISRKLPRQLHAGQLAKIELFVENRKRRLASYSVSIEDTLQNKQIDKKCLYLRIAPRQTLSASYSHSFATRGKHVLEGFRVSTTFPFGLFEKSVLIQNRQEVIVLPALTPVRTLPANAHLFGENRANRVGRHGEFFGLREYRAGDDKRSIHWASSAKRDRLLVREFEEEAQKRFTIVVDNALPHLPTWQQQQTHEHAIVRAASFARLYIRNGFAVALLSRTDQIPFGAGAGHLHFLLRALALLETVGPEVAFPHSPTPNSAHVICGGTLESPSKSGKKNEAA